MRPETGTNIWAPIGLSGHGTLRIDNGTGFDAVAKLKDVESDAVRQFVYIRAGNKTELKNIGPCRCSLYFELGFAWDEKEESFCAVTGYEVFDESFGFAETEAEVVNFSITLHPVRTGKATTTRLSKEEFEKQVGKSHRRK
jgi:hypothetical protein